MRGIDKKASGQVLGENGVLGYGPNKGKLD